MGVLTSEVTLSRWRSWWRMNMKYEEGP
jgi:hypothetical protein